MGTVRRTLLKETEKYWKQKIQIKEYESKRLVGQRGGRSTEYQEKKKENRKQSDLTKRVMKCR